MNLLRINEDVSRGELILTCTPAQDMMLAFKIECQDLVKSTYITITQKQLVEGS